jgi:hypothetical protein
MFDEVSLETRATSGILNDIPNKITSCFEALGGGILVSYDDSTSNALTCEV